MDRTLLAGAAAIGRCWVDVWCDALRMRAALVIGTAVAFACCIVDSNMDGVCVCGLAARRAPVCGASCS